MNRSRSEELHRSACARMPGGVNSPVRAFRQVGGTPVFFRDAAGSRFRDEDGNEYVDWCGSWGPLILGHAHPAVVEAVAAAAGRGLTYGACHRGELELASLILDGFPGLDRVRLVSSGTEAVMTALRLARGVTGRDLVVKFEGGYHGHSDGLLVKAGSGLATQAIVSSAGVPAGVAEATLALPLDDEGGLREVFERQGQRIAAVIVEPLPANEGLLVQRPDFLRLVRDLTRECGALLVFDEVITGFRLHYGGYGRLVGVEPDLVTLGKIIGGGMPVGAVVGRAAHLDQLAPLGRVYQAGTLSGNPVSLAAGAATLRLLRDDPPYARLEAVGQVLAEGLAAADRPDLRLRRVGSIAWLYLDRGEFPRRSTEIAPAAVDRFRFLHGPLLDRGHYLPPSAYEVLFISAAHTETEAAELAAEVRALSPGINGRRGSGA